MISALFFFSPKGDVLMARFYKNDVHNNVHDVFRIQVVNAPAKFGAPHGARLPVVTIGSTSFISIRSGVLWLVAVARSNQNCAAILEFLYALENLLLKLFGPPEGPLSEDTVLGNFVAIFEVLGEVLELGYPSNMEPAFLSSVIPALAGTRACALDRKESLLKRKISRHLPQPRPVDQAYDTSKVSWREPGIKYRQDEIFLNVDEKVSVLLDRTGHLLRSHIDGTITMKCHLSGMPTCRFGFSCDHFDDDLRETITLDDFKFHKCVDLAKYDAEQVIAFVPPDGAFQLMSYNVADAHALPFSIVPQLTVAADRVSLHLRVLSNYAADYTALLVILRVHVPPATLCAFMRVSQGKARFDTSESAVVWRHARFYGSQSHELTVDLDAAGGAAAIKPRISLDFLLDSHSASGLQVRFLKVSERANYRPIKWVKYSTQAGSYELRL